MGGEGSRLSGLNARGKGRSCGSIPACVCIHIAVAKLNNSQQCAETYMQTTSIFGHTRRGGGGLGGGDGVIKNASAL